MAFASGAVSFRRFFITGRLPAIDSDEMVSKVAARAFGAGTLVGIDQTETGWISPRHLFDAEITSEKIAVGRFVSLSLRLDRLKIPASVFKSYVQLEEEVALQASGKSFLSKAEKKHAREAALLRAEKEMRSGAFRRIAAYPILIDTRSKSVFLGSGGTAVADKLMQLFRETFDCGLEPANSERLAYRSTEAGGAARSLENAMPFALIGEDGDVEGAEDQNFLGREFLTWLWFRGDGNHGPIKTASGDTVAMVIDRTIRLECIFGRSGSTVVTRDGPANSPEAASAIRLGKQATRLGLILGGTAGEFTLTLDGPQMTVSGLNLPRDEQQRSPWEWVEHRFEQIVDFCELLDGMYGAFIKRRVSADWPREIAEMRAWARRDVKPEAVPA